jgi:hypothetical protein
MNNFRHRDEVFNIFIVYLALFLSGLCWLISCTGAKTNQFDSFAQAGVKFADALPPVLDDSFQYAVETDSLVLIESREGLNTSEERLVAIETSNENLSERVMLINDLKRHARLLRSYFIALKALAQSERASGISDVTKGLVDSLKKIDKRILSTSIGGIDVNNLVGKATKVSVATFQSAALNRELKLHAEIIEREVSIQQAVLSVLRDAMKGDKNARNAFTDREKIIRPFVVDKNLPKNWSALRLEVLKKKIEFSSMNAALDAAQALRLNFIALSENRLSDDSITVLMQDIDRILIFTENVSSSK